MIKKCNFIPRTNDSLRTSKIYFFVVGKLHSEKASITYKYSLAYWYRALSFNSWSHTSDFATEVAARHSSEMELVNVRRAPLIYPMGRLSRTLTSVRCRNVGKSTSLQRQRSYFGVGVEGNAAGEINEDGRGEESIDGDDGEQELEVVDEEGSKPVASW
jgi:hypothetical protein